MSRISARNLGKMMTLVEDKKAKTKSVFARWRAKNVERERARSAAYYAAKRKEENERSAAYYRLHAEEIKRQKTEKRHQNLEEMKAYWKRWRVRFKESNPVEHARLPEVWEKLKDCYED